jgi:WD40 repeat protein
LSSGSSGGGGSSDGGSGSLQTYSTKVGRLVSALRTDPGGRRITTLSFNHNGNMLATGGADGFIRVFDMITSQAIMGWVCLVVNVVEEVPSTIHSTCD